MKCFPFFCFYDVRSIHYGAVLMACIEYVIRAPWITVIVPLFFTKHILFVQCILMDNL
jgi:hypothetical protein